MDKLKLFIFLLMISLFSNQSFSMYDKLAFDFKFDNIDGGSLNLSKYKNKVILIINVASQCGFTKQYEDMQKIWESYQTRDFIVIGVPSNNFGGQEPGDNKDIKNFCETKFGITFPMAGKVNVKGPNAHPFYKWAKKNHGLSAVPKWNFHKIIINKKGKIETTFSSITKPTSKKLIKVIENLIN